MVGAPPLYVWYKSFFPEKSTEELREYVRNHDSKNFFGKLMCFFNPFNDDRNQASVAEEVLKDREREGKLAKFY